MALAHQKRGVLGAGTAQKGGSSGADPGGGGQGCLGPPPFSGEKNKGAKNHTHRRKKDQNRTTTKQDTG